MSYNVLGARRTRYYAHLLGIPFDRIITRGGSGHTFRFRTIYHEHGMFWFDSENGQWSCQKNQWWNEEIQWYHWTTCRERFPEDFEGYPPYRYIGHRGSVIDPNGV